MDTLYEQFWMSLLYIGICHQQSKNHCENLPKNLLRAWQRKGLRLCDRAILKRNYVEVLDRRSPKLSVLEYSIMEKNKVIKCSPCKGTGIQEETIKGYRRYKCDYCNGEKEVPNPFWEEEQEEDTQQQPTP